MPLESDPQRTYGAGLSNVEYAYICEEMGKTTIASEVLFYCFIYQNMNVDVAGAVAII